MLAGIFTNNTVFMSKVTNKNMKHFGVMEAVSYHVKCHDI